MGTNDRNNSLAGGLSSLSNIGEIVVSTLIEASS